MRQLLWQESHLAWPMVGDLAPTLCTVQGVRWLLKVKLHMLLAAASPKGVDRRVLQC